MTIAGNLLLLGSPEKFIKIYQLKIEDNQELKG
jgi:hypothetical protein